MLTLTTEQLKTLKQNNISVDAAKTTERAQQSWKSQKNATKNDLLVFAGCSAPSVHRIYKTGAIHIKMAIAFGQVFNINPYYLTGEVDEPGEFTEALLLQLRPPAQRRRPPRPRPSAYGCIYAWAS